MTDKEKDLGRRIEEWNDLAAEHKTM